MDYRVRPGSPTDGPVLMHMEHACRLAAQYLPEEARWFKPRQWRAWVQCQPPYARNPTERRIYVAYNGSDILGFIAAAQDSIYGGYDSHVHGIYVLPRYRRHRIGFALLQFMALWLDQHGSARLTVSAFAGDPTREFFRRMGAFVIDSGGPMPEPGTLLTYGFPSVRALALNIE